VHNGGTVPEALRGSFFTKYATSGKSTGLGYGFAWAAAECRALERDAAHGEAAALTARATAVRAHLERAEIRFAPAEDAAPDPG